MKKSDIVIQQLKTQGIELVNIPISPHDPDDLKGIPTVRPKDFTIHSIDNGFCRVNYKAKNCAGETVFYCLQDEGKNYGGVVCYRCSRDFEPNYSIKYNRNRFEVPTGNSDIEIVVREYLTKE